MIKTNLGVVLNFYLSSNEENSSLQNLLSQKMPFSTVSKIKKILDAVMFEVKTFDEMRTKASERLKDDEVKFKEEIDEILRSEIEIDVDKIKSSEIPNDIKLTYQEYINLSLILEDN